MDEGVQAALRLARTSRELFAVPSVEGVRQMVVRAAQAAVDPCEDAVVSERTGKVLRAAAATSGLAEACDELQHRRREGPSVEVAWNSEVSLVSDAARETRWPELGRRISELGMSSVLSVRLAAGSDVLGSLSLYSAEVEAFDAGAIAAAFSFAAHAAVALHSARQREAYTESVETRHLIGVAQGILMARYGLDREQSFELLRRHSNRSNTKLREVAQHVADLGEVPQDDPVLRAIDGPEPGRPPRQRQPGRAGAPRAGGRGDSVLPPDLPSEAGAG